MKILFAALLVLIAGCSSAPQKNEGDRTPSSTRPATEFNAWHCIDGLSAQMYVYYDRKNPNYVRVQNVGHDGSVIVSSAVQHYGGSGSEVSYVEESGRNFVLFLAIDGRHEIWENTSKGRIGQHELECRNK